jgi:hypothetical protein
MLVFSESVQIIIDDRVVAPFFKFLLRATSSTANEIVKNGAVRLPTNTDANGIIQLVNRLKDPTNAGKCKGDSRSLSRSLHLR